MVRMRTPSRNLLQLARQGIARRLSGKLRAGGLRSAAAAAEAGAIVLRADAELAVHDAAKILFAAQAGHRGDALKRQSGLFERMAGRLDAHELDRLGGSLSGLGGIEAGEGARAHAGLLGEPVDAQV